MLFSLLTFPFSWAIKFVRILKYSRKNIYVVLKFDQGKLEFIAILTEPRREFRNFWAVPGKFDGLWAKFVRGRLFGHIF